MRLPLRHAPPANPPGKQSCAHLEVLLEAAQGLPLGPAAAFVASKRSRGRHGNALQWHLGLDAHDGNPTLDWEDRIEIKLVSVWRSGSHAVACDKLKVCDVNVSPWHKLGNVAFVFADRLTRVVLGHRLFHLDRDRLERLGQSWHQDPHFDMPSLFIEARERANASAPAYYVAARWFEREGLLPAFEHGLFAFDSKWHAHVRATTRRDPLLTVVDGVPNGRVGCPRCAGALSYAADKLGVSGWAPATHAHTLDVVCGPRAHVVLRADHLLRSRGVLDPLRTRALLEHREDPREGLRLAELVGEPEDHEHNM